MQGREHSSPMIGVGGHSVERLLHGDPTALLPNDPRPERHPVPAAPAERTSPLLEGQYPGRCRHSLPLDPHDRRVSDVGSPCAGPIPGAIPGAIEACACRLEQQLKIADHENRSLRDINEHLSASLADIIRQRSVAQHMALHDGLTGLPNRQMLMQRLQDGIAESFLHQRQLALMFIDLDGFKIVNDRYGHSTGDKLLTVVASRIASCVRSEDLACRYGGDEFVVMLADISEAAVAVGISEEIRNRIDGRYWIEGQELQISASIGLALYPTDGDQWDTLLTCADASMYRNKLSRGERRSLPSLAALDLAERPMLTVNGPSDGGRPNYVRYQTDARGIPL